LSFVVGETCHRRACPIETNRSDRYARNCSPSARTPGCKHVLVEPDTGALGTTVDKADALQKDGE